MAELVAEADASVGAFYNRFRDKDALLHVHISTSNARLRPRCSRYDATATPTNARTITSTGTAEPASSCAFSGGMSLWFVTNHSPGGISAFGWSKADT